MSQVSRIRALPDTDFFPRNGEFPHQRRGQIDLRIFSQLPDHPAPFFRIVTLRRLGGRLRNGDFGSLDLIRQIHLRIIVEPCFRRSNGRIYRGEEPVRPRQISLPCRCLGYRRSHFFSRGDRDATTGTLFRGRERSDQFLELLLINPRVSHNRPDPGWGSLRLRRG